MWHIYLITVTLCLSAFMLNLVLNMRALHRLGRGKAGLPDPAPLISILVPARNEEKDIVPCLESLRRQDYPNYEILVLDDGSSDSTAALVAEIAARDHRVRLLEGQPLPKGWAGKPFACHQLASQARGSWLLFTDADTTHAPSMLRSALTYARDHDLSLLSGLPLQNTVSLSQRVVIPTFYFAILSLFPLWWLQGSRVPKPGLSIGQFLFVSARDYREVGGHEAVKSRILEDVWLGFAMVRRGKRQAVVDLSEVVTCRMYEGLRELWEGFSKWTYSFASLSLWLPILIILAGTSLFLAPFALLAWHYAPFVGDLDWSLIIVVQVLIILLMRLLVDHRFGHSGVYSLSHPASVSFILLSCAYGSVKRLTGHGVHWKERLYGSQSGVR
ncbi:MAG: glycosyltransferase [Chloroflexi bacterium]|nr:glycosyltransferase [Chloroflexota bacterium]